MSLFHENLKQILAEVEKFLNESLKKEKLGKKALEHKAIIMEKLESFFQENPTMKLNQSQETVSVSDDSVMTGGSTVSDESEGTYNDAGLAIVAVSELKDPVYAGFLEKKQKKGLFGTAKFQTRWCVIHKGNFYYFSKQDDKKQHGSFVLEGYRFRNAPDLVPKKKELCFELYHPDDKKRIYQFMAKNKEEYEQWQTFVESGGYPLIEEDIYDQVGEGSSEAAAKAMAPKVVENPEPPPEEIEEQIYEDTDSVSDLPLPPPPELTSPHPPPSKLPPPPVPPVVPPSVPPLSKLPPPVPPPVTRSPASQPKSPKAIDTAVVDADEELYDDALSAVKTEEEPLPPPPPPVPGRNLPPTPPVPVSIPKRPTRDLPPTPVPKKQIKINLTCKPAEDFENKFYGKWDCTADNDSELSFKRGDIIHILSREFDEKSWWVGELNGSFGLVPKNFLVPAYTLVTH